MCSENIHFHTQQPTVLPSADLIPLTDLLGVVLV